MVLNSAPLGSIPYSGVSMTGLAAGKIALPVAPASVIYAHFEHVAGVPAPEGSRGVTVSKLKILDTLIEQLAKIKKQPEPTFGGGGELTDDRADALIKQYEGQLKQASAASKAMPYLPKPVMDSGLLIDLRA